MHCKHQSLLGRGVWGAPSFFEGHRKAAGITEGGLESRLLRHEIHEDDTSIPILSEQMRCGWQNASTRRRSQPGRTSGLDRHRNDPDGWNVLAMLCIDARELDAVNHR